VCSFRCLVRPPLLFCGTPTLFFCGKELLFCGGIWPSFLSMLFLPPRGNISLWGGNNKNHLCCTGFPHFSTGGGAHSTGWWSPPPTRGKPFVGPKFVLRWAPPRGLPRFSPQGGGLRLPRITYPFLALKNPWI